MVDGPPMNGSTFCPFRTCMKCGVQFVRVAQRGTVPKFCSAACRQRAHRGRHASEPTAPDQIETLLRLADILESHAATYRAEAAALSEAMKVPA